MELSSFATRELVARVSPAAGIHLLVIEPEGPGQARIQLFLGELGTHGEAEAAIVRDQLDAIMQACRAMYDQVAPEPGPDDPTDEPSDEPAQVARRDWRGDPTGEWDWTRPARQDRGHAHPMTALEARALDGDR